MLLICFYVHSVIFSELTGFSLNILHSSRYSQSVLGSQRLIISSKNSFQSSSDAYNKYR